MFKIGYRTLKTAVGVTVSIFIAHLLGLDYYASAGIITILCIQATKKKSLQSSWSRFVAGAIAMVYSVVFFQLIGYTPLTIGLILLLFIPTTVYFRIQEGIVTSSVVIFHLYDTQTFSPHLILNEFALILIGIGVALIMNLYMPSVDKQLKLYQKEIETNFSIIFKEVANYLKQKDSNWDGKEITTVHQIIQSAKSLAFRDIQNHFLRHENIYYSYFKIREQQLEIIERILPIVTSLDQTGIQGEMLAEFIEDLSDSIHPGNTAKRFLDKVEGLKKEFREMDLPTTREEFEARASLFQFLKEMEQYLIIKSYFRPNHE
ncbi:aromatic acid exporter family protein [Bacillus salitolerans]|uniref:Aromatic acid exporter family protein n=1 Tax=Bacillus salitolerans TaxID=1437434 RepID=A0ABW4LMJ2_9BACI